jgi:hypothetical protein
MFDQTDIRFVAVPPAQAEGVLMGIVQQGGFYVQPTGPGMWACRAMPTYGFIPHLNVRMTDRGGTIEISLHGYGEFDQSSMVVAIVLLILFWPAAAVLAYLAYDGIQRRFRTLAQHVWWQLPPVQQAYAAQPPYGGQPPGP